MKKKVLLLLSLLLALSFTSCSTKQEKDDIGENPYKDYNQITTSYGLSYKVPKKWKTTDSNTETASYYYKNEVGSGDGMLYVTYDEFDGSILDDKVFEEFKNGLKQSENYKDGLTGEYTEVNNIPVEKLRYNMKIEDNTYKVTSAIFDCGSGYAVVSMMSFPKNNYDSYFNKVLKSINIDETLSTEEATESTTEATTETKKNNNSSSNIKDINTYDIIFTGDYRNDTTGKWRLATTSDSFDIQKYAVSYYNNYFKSDDEIHIIVNFTRMTTTKISNMGGILDVQIHDYVKGEEHDAKEALSGTLLNEYHVDISSGKITKIQ